MKKAKTNCFNSSQFQMENNRWVSVTNKDSVDGKTWEAFEVRSLEHPVAKLAFLESKWFFIFSEIR